jgi:protein TonB
MSPTAAGMAATLHLVVALALLWGTPVKNFEVPEQAIDVTMEEPPAPRAETPPPPPPTPPAAQAQPAPPPAKTQPLGLPPVGAKPTATDKPKSLPLGLPPPSERTTEPPQQAAAQPPPPKQEPQPEPPQQAAAEPSPPKPEPQPEPAEAAKTKLPSVEVPPAPLSMQDFVRAAPPPPPQEIVRPQPRLQPSPPPQMQTPTVQQHPPPQLQPSPLHTQQPQQQPQQSQASAALVNPADAVARSRIVEDYLWQVGRKISEHPAFAPVGNEQGTVVLRLTIARDGRLMEGGVARSSGSKNLDAAALAAARSASPYPPLPAELTQDTFILPMNYKKKYD